MMVTVAGLPFMSKARRARQIALAGPVECFFHHFRDWRASMLMLIRR
jgi:hypothetical protein